MGSNNPKEDPIETLFKETYCLLYIYSKSVLNDSALAEEAVQETFCIACAKSMHLLSSPNPKGWLMNTTKNVLKNIIRKREKLIQVTADSLPIDLVLAVSPPECDVDTLYCNISDRADFKLLKKIALDQYTIAEAAEELGISVEACKKRVQRAKKNLQNLFL